MLLNVSAKKTLNVLNAKRKKPSQQRRVKHRKKLIALSARLSRKKRRVWQKRSAKPTSRQSVKLT